MDDRYTNENLKNREEEESSCAQVLETPNPTHNIMLGSRTQYHVSSIYSSYKYFTLLFLNHLHIFIQRKTNFRMEPQFKMKSL